MFIVVSPIAAHHAHCHWAQLKLLCFGANLTVQSGQVTLAAMSLLCQCRWGRQYKLQPGHMGQQQLMLVDGPEASASMSGSAAVTGEEGPVSSSGSDKSSAGPGSESGDSPDSMTAGDGVDGEDGRGMAGGAGTSSGEDGDGGVEQRAGKKPRQQRMLMPGAAAAGAPAVAAGSSDEQVVPTLCEVPDIGAAVAANLRTGRHQQQRHGHVHKHHHRAGKHLHAAVGGDDAAMSDGDYRPRAYYEISDSMGAIPAASLSTACSKFVRPAVGVLQQQQESEEGEASDGDVEMDGPAEGEGLLLVQEAARLHIAQAGQ